MKTINLAEKLGQFSSQWDPHVIANYNGNNVMVVKFQGEFSFHVHPDTDDFSSVLKGITHHPRAENECKVLLIKPKGEPNTGNPETAAHKPHI